MSVTAVFAHYDTCSQFDPVFLRVVTALGKHCHKVVVVSTAPRSADLPPFPRSVTYINRPNIGYDFLSYASALSVLGPSEPGSKLILVNSSFVVCDDSLFDQTLVSLVRYLDTHNMVALTASDQIKWHLQSYLLAFDHGTATATWFRNFFDNVHPQDSKLSYILKYEIGLSEAAMQAGLVMRSMYEVNWSRAPEDWHAARETGVFNPVHFAAEQIARRFGIIKTEVLRNNPHRIDLGSLNEAMSDNNAAEIAQFVGRTSASYAKSPDGLTTLRRRAESLCPDEIVRYPTAAEYKPRIAVVAHVFYKDLLPELLAHTANVIEPVDYLITTPFEQDIPTLIDLAAPRAANVIVALVKNQGRDIRPFLSLLLTGLLDDYAAILKLHTKKSLYSRQGDSWRERLFHDLCGTSYIARKSISLLLGSKVGIVGSRRYFLSHPRFMGANATRLCELLKAAQAPYLSQPELAFFAGSMFWFKPQALAPLRRIPTEALRFEEENGQQDGTLAHAVERSFSLVSASQGLISTSVENDGRDLFEDLDNARSVPVL